MDYGRRSSPCTVFSLRVEEQYALRCNIRNKNQSKYDLIGQTDGSSGWTLNLCQLGDSTNPLDPKLDPTGLQDNGGPTETIKLLPTSPGFQTGDNALAGTTDQCGDTRVNPVSIGAYDPGAKKLGTWVNLDSSLNASDEGQAVTFTATVMPCDTGEPTGTVSFYDGNTALDTETLDSSGEASFTTSTLPVGDQPLTVVYNGDSNFTGSTSALSFQEVDLPATSVYLSSSLDSSQNGQSVTFTATVTPSYYGTAPTGTVTFYDGTTALDTETLTSSGAVSYTTSALATGNHPLTAVYSGDSTWGGTISNVFTQEVDQATTSIYLGSSLSSAGVGQNVTFTAWVSPSYFGTPLTGTVSFYDGSTLLGTATLDNSGEASFTISTLSVGNHPITAVYSDDAVFSGSTSNVFTQQVTS